MFYDVRLTLPLARRLSEKMRGVVLATTSQTAIQLLGLVTGLVVVRLLTVREYAYYTIANAALGSMSVLSDSGIADSVIAQGGKVWTDRRALGGLIAAALSLRKRLALLATGVSLPLLYLLLRRQGATPITAVLVAASIIPVYASTLTGQLFEIVPRLHQLISPLQRIQVGSAGLRFALATATAAFLPLAWPVNLCAGLAQLWANRRTRKLAERLADLHARPLPESWSACVRQIRRSAPSAVYYAFAGQITIFLASMFGKISGVASVGALARLAMVFNIFGAVFALLWVPRFARLTSDRPVTRVFWLAELALVGTLALPILYTTLLPTTVLWVLGPAYGSLTKEVVIAVAGGALGVLGGCTYWLAAARGVVVAPWVLIPLALLVQVILILRLPLSTVAGVLWLGVFTNLAYWIMHLGNFTIAQSRFKAAESRRTVSIGRRMLQWLWKIARTVLGLTLGRALARLDSTGNRFVRTFLFDAAQRSSRIPLLLYTGGREQYVLNARDEMICRSVFVHGEFDADKLERAMSIVRSRLQIERVSVLIDVGANVGTICIPAVCRGHAERAVAIEPHPQNCRLLRTNVALNGLHDRIAVFECASGADEDGTIEIVRSSDNWGDIRVAIESEGTVVPDGPRHTVASHRVDDLVGAPPGTPLLWIDTQGFEGVVLLGATALLGRRVPLVIEFDPSLLARVPHGLESLAQAVSGYRSMFDLERPNDERSPGEMYRLRDEMAAQGRAFTDLLLL